MKFIPTVVLSFLLGGTALAIPTGNVPRDDAPPQTVHLTFNGGPASYEMAFPADGTFYPTNNDISVSIIDAPDYLALQDCTFQTAGEQTLVGGLSADGNQQVIVGPPQPITAVSCSGMCVANYSRCYDDNGQWVGPCCNGYCAANLCRPWNGV